MFRFLLALWKVNLLSAMEYRAAFLTQVFGMMLNNAFYFVFWFIFFDTFALYPITLFDGTAKLLLFTVIPAAFVGAVPAAFVRHFDAQLLGQILLAAGVALGLALVVFYRGLRRYESGSAIQVRM